MIRRFLFFLFVDPNVDELQRRPRIAPIQLFLVVGDSNKLIQNGSLFGIRLLFQFRNDLTNSQLLLQFVFVFSVDGRQRRSLQLLGEFPSKELVGVDIPHAVARANATGADGNGFGAVHDVAIRLYVVGSAALVTGDVALCAVGQIMTERHLQFLRDDHLHLESNVRLPTGDLLLDGPQLFHLHQTSVDERFESLYRRFQPLLVVQQLAGHRKRLGVHPVHRVEKGIETLGCHGPQETVVGVVDIQIQ